MNNTNFGIVSSMTMTKMDFLPKTNIFVDDTFFFQNTYFKEH